MEILFTILYVCVSLFLILVVLLQSGKAGDLASTFGGMSSQTALGSRGTANFLSKATTICAALFLVLALLLALLSSTHHTSRLEGVEDLENPAPVEENTAAPAPEATAGETDAADDGGTPAAE